MDNDTDSDTDTDTDTAEIGDQSGTVGYSEMSPDGDFDREKVLVDGEEYIISNNNWGDPENTNLILAYFNNSFEIVEGSASGAPAAFPTIYIGANGETGNGIASTSATDNLPMRVSDISSANTSFAWSGSTSSFTTTYDVWFANSSPTEMYDDGIDGFMMIWVHDPSDAPPIGSSQGSESVAGETWDVWVGPRGEGPAGYNDATVVSFVAGSDIRSKSFDLKDFMDAASGYGISSSMYLTDVFFGFEIWNGGAGGNLSVDEFTCKVE